MSRAFAHSSTVTAALTYELPAILGGERRCYAAERINSMLNRCTPTEIVTDAKPIIPDYPFGQIGLFYHTTVSAGDMQSSRDMGIIVKFNRDARNKYRVCFPLRGSVLARCAFQPLAKPPAEWDTPAGSAQPRYPRSSQWMLPLRRFLQCLSPLPWILQSISSAPPAI